MRERLSVRRLVGFLLGLILVLPAGAAADSTCNPGHPCPPTPPPVAMGRLITAGAETGHFHTEGLTTTPVTIFDATHVRSGTNAYMPSGSTGWTVAGAVGTTYYARTYVYKTATNVSQSGLVFINTLANGTGTDLALIRLETDNTLLLRFGGTNHQGTTTVGSASAALQDNTWYRIEVSVVIGVGAIDAIEARIDGVTFASGSSLTISDTAPGSFFIAPGGISGNMWHDDIAVNDSAGASQNTWPGEGKEVLLLPTADSAVGTGWTLGTGTAIAANGFGSVDNTPPTGVADLAALSDPKQIRNAASAANSNYDATMTTYTAAGIAAGATINVIDPLIETAAPIVTSAKAGTVGVVSNPAIANVALGAGGTPGAFWSGTTGGTYQTGWKLSHGTTTYGSSVTLGTAPVMRVTQVTASTRIAVVCFMGIYVDYTPAVVPQIAYVNPMPPIIAQ